MAVQGCRVWATGAGGGAHAKRVFSEIVGGVVLCPLLFGVPFLFVPCKVGLAHGITVWQGGECLIGIIHGKCCATHNGCAVRHGVALQSHVNRRAWCSCVSKPMAIAVSLLAVCKWLAVCNSSCCGKSQLPGLCGIHLVVFDLLISTRAGYCCSSPPLVVCGYSFGLVLVPLQQWCRTD